MELNEENEEPIKSGTTKQSKSKEKKSFWKDKKNIAIVVLIFLLFCVCATDDKEQINSLTQEKENLKNQVATLENEKAELSNKFNSSKDEEKTQLRSEIEKEYKEQIEKLTNSNTEKDDKIKNQT